MVDTGPLRGANALLTAFGLGLVVALGWAMFDPMAQFMAFGFAACLIVTLPMLVSGYRLFDPWSMVALVVYLGCGFRSVFVAAQVDGPRTVDSLFLLNNPPEHFVRGSAIYLLGLGILALAYSSLRGAPAQPDETSKWFGSYEFNRAFGLVVAILVAVGLVGLVLYVRSTGGGLATLSAKRSVIDSADAAGSDYQAHSMLRQLNSASAIAFALVQAKFAHEGQRLTVGRLLLLFGLFVNAAALAVYSSQRTGVVYLLVGALVIELCLRRDRRGLARRAGTLALAAVVMFGALTTLRAADRAPEQGLVSVSSVSDSLVYNRNLADVTTSALIIEAVGDQLQPKYGATITTWVFAPIPRSVWPGKPIVSVGPEVGSKVYGNARAGVPPGFVAEMYWNFQLLGVVIGCWLLGRVLGWIRRFIRRNQSSPAAVILYASALFPFAGQVLVISLGQAVFGLFVSGVIVMVAMKFAGTSKPRETPSLEKRTPVPQPPAARG